MQGYAKRKDFSRIPIETIQFKEEVMKYKNLHACPYVLLNLLNKLMKR